MEEEQGAEANKPERESAQNRPAINIIRRFSVPVPAGGEVELRIWAVRDTPFFNKLCSEPQVPREFTIRLLAHQTSNPESLDYTSWDDIALLAAAKVWSDHNRLTPEACAKIESLDSFRDAVCQRETRDRQRTERQLGSLQLNSLERAGHDEARRRSNMFPELRYFRESERLRLGTEYSAAALRATETLSGVVRTGDVMRAALGLDPSYRYKFEPALEITREHIRDLDILGGKKVLPEKAGAGNAVNQLNAQLRDLTSAPGTSAGSLRLTNPEAIFGATANSLRLTNPEAVFGTTANSLRIADLESVFAATAGRFRTALPSDITLLISSERASLSGPMMASYLPSAEKHNSGQHP
jgi:hypothetical protein